MRRTSGYFATLVLCLSTLQARAGGWDVRPSPTTLPLYGVASSDPATWVAVGAGGTIVRSTDGGVLWSAVTNPAGDTLRGVSFNGGVGLAVGLAGQVLRTMDGGATWALETRPTHKNLYSVSMDSSMAVITGEEGGIFVSTDNGLTWLQHFAGTASVLFGVSVSGSTGVGVGGAGAVVMSPNGGSGWGLTVIGTPLTFFYATSFATPQTGWLVGSDATFGSIIARSDDSGFVWSAQHAPTPSQLFGVSFPDTSSGTAVGDLGTILHTSDGGVLWSPQSSGVGVTLNAVAFNGVTLGVAVGDNGTILRTTSGGATGAPPPVADGKLAGSAALFSKSATIPGSIGVLYDATSCSAQKAVILYGTLGDFASYQGCAQADAGNAGTATFDASALENVWFNVVWTDGTVGGHPGYGLDRATSVERDWNAAGFCGLASDDHTDGTCP